MEAMLLAVEHDFNPRSPHGERHLFRQRVEVGRRISIHAPRTGSDENLLHTVRDYIISIHAPRTGSDLRISAHTVSRKLFQSTLPARGATEEEALTNVILRHFNPRSPHGERQQAENTCRELMDFNPRSPHGERLRRPAWRTCRSYFNPRSPHGERR